MSTSEVFEVGDHRLCTFRCYQCRVSYEHMLRACGLPCSHKRAAGLLYRRLDSNELYSCDEWHVSHDQMLARHRSPS